MLMWLMMWGYCSFAGNEEEQISDKILGLWIQLIDLLREALYMELSLSLMSFRKHLI